MLKYRQLNDTGQLGRYRSFAPPYWKVRGSEQAERIDMARDWKEEAAAPEHAALVYRALLGSLEVAGSTDPIDDAMLFANHKAIRQVAAAAVVQGRLRFEWYDNTYAIVRTWDKKRRPYSQIVSWTSQMGYDPTDIDENVKFVREMGKVKGVPRVDLTVIFFPSGKEPGRPLEVLNPEGKADIKLMSQDFTVNNEDSILIKKRPGPALEEPGFKGGFNRLTEGLSCRFELFENEVGGRAIGEVAQLMEAAGFTFAQRTDVPAVNTALELDRKWEILVLTVPEMNPPKYCFVNSIGALCSNNLTDSFMLSKGRLILAKRL